jgi:hypothetical protein
MDRWMDDEWVTDRQSNILNPCQEIEMKPKTKTGSRPAGSPSNLTWRRTRTGRHINCRLLTSQTLKRTPKTSQS